MAKPRLRLKDNVWHAEEVFSGQGHSPYEALGRMMYQERISPTAGANVFDELAFADPFHLFPSSVFSAFNPSVLVSRKSLRVFDEMRRDDQVKAAMLFKKHAILAGGWEIISPEGEPNDWKPSEFLRSQFLQFKGTLEQRLLVILSALDYGFSVTELMYEPIPQGEMFAGLIGLKELKSVSPHGIDFPTDQFGVLQGITQEANPQRLLNKDKFIIYTHQKEFGNHYGKSDLEAAYEPWWMKTNSVKWLGMLLERYGIPPIFGLYNPLNFTAQQVENLKTVFTRLQAATSGLIPRTDKDSLELWTPELAEQVATVFIPSLDRFDMSIAKALLMPNMLGVTPDRLGSFARAKVVFDVFMFVIESLRRQLEEEVVNEQLIKPLVSLNFQVDEFPRFEFLPLTNEIEIDIFKAWNDLIQTGAVTSGLRDEEHIRSQFGFPDKEEPALPALTPAADAGVPLEQPVLPVAPPNTFAQWQGQQTQNKPVQRQPNSFERKVDFQQIGRVLESADARTIQRMMEVLVEIKKKVKEQIPAIPGGEITPADIEAASLDDVRAELTPVVEEQFTKVFEQGTKDIKKEIAAQRRLSRMQFDPSFILQDALQALQEQAFITSLEITDQILMIIKREMVFGMQNGLPLREVVDRILEALIPWLGQPQQLNPRLLNPPRIRAIVRTQQTNTYNKGRLVQARDPELEGLVQGMQYSAIIDQVTTEVCTFLDEKIFRIDDVDLNRLTPPNHVNCRSVLIPVLIDEDLQPGDFISKEQKGRATELAQKGFA